MDDVCDNPLEIELQSLEAIYVNELTFSRKDDGSVDKIEVLVHPATGHDTTKQYVCMTLVFVPGPKYPDEIPDIEIRNPRGLGEEEVASLVEAMILKGEEVKGEVMLYTFIEVISV
ncbi:E3 ubiquitin-protein ligase rnf25 [Bulinus truncatus]|nr:E3 ubiquitin-protein ligase rnf25 [Bulinus truncatus]